jgi:hypothetical protein
MNKLITALKIPVILLYICLSITSETLIALGMFIEFFSDKISDFLED